jgi:hypothetical protein
MSPVRTFAGKLLWVSSLVLSFNIATANRVSANTPETAPAELKEAISQIEAAANRRNIKEVLAFYSPDFSNSDGMKLSSLEQSLTQLWQDYSSIKYTTQILSWEQQQDGRLVAETQTTIQGSKKSKVRNINLESKIRSRQYFQNKKLVSQEILAETTKITSGETPPNVEVRLPETVKVGELFDFDVIVNEPIGDDLLLGAAMEERVSGNLYLNPSKIQLEELYSGGIFKQVKAPLLPDKRWLSAIIIRGDGIVQITQRVLVTNK